MPLEIERKFLVAKSSWRDQIRASHTIQQGYLNTTDTTSVRVRVIDNSLATLTVKLPKSGLSRFEFEQAITLREGQTLLDLCESGILVKTRHTIDHDGLVWVIDEYHGHNSGLVIAEIELEREDQLVPLPPWLGKDVTGVARYQNSVLARTPYRAEIDEASAKAS